MSFKKIDEKELRPNEPHKLIIYGYEDSEKTAILNALKIINEKDFYFIDNNILDTTVYDLISNQNIISAPINTSIPNIKFMFMSGFSNKEIHNLFKTLKSFNIKMPIGAILTSSNKNFLFKDLLKEVYFEHTTMLNKTKNIKQISH